jgi:hypothetical protein
MGRFGDGVAGKYRKYGCARGLRGAMCPKIERNAGDDANRELLVVACESFQSDNEFTSDAEKC